MVDVAAPGGDQSVAQTDGVYSTLNAGTKAPGADSYAWYQGTSMAAPHVAGVVALMLARNPALTPDDIDARLKATARALPVACPQGCGAGIVDANAAVDAAVAPAPPPPPPPPPAPPAPPGTAETEPNDSIATAQSLSWPATVNASITSAADTDYYRLVIAPGKSAVVTMAPNATSDYDLYAYNDAGARTVTSSAGTGQVDTVTLSNSSTSASMTAYLRVLYFSGGVGATAGKYTLTIR
jgi:serine protease